MLGYLHVYLCESAHKFKEGQTGVGQTKEGRQRVSSAGSVYIFMHRK